MIIANARRCFVPALLLIANCSQDLPSSGDGGGPVPEASLGPCAPFTPDLAFEALRFDGHPLDKVYGVWGLADDDIYVALGDEASRAAVVHWNGSVWALDPLPKLWGVDAVTGRSGADLWLAGPSPPSGVPVILRNSGGSGWWSAPVPPDYVADMILLPPDDGWMTGTEFNPGVTFRLTGGTWSAVTLPSIGQSYFFQKLRAKDAKHVLSIGRATPTPTSTGVARFLGAFDGMSWKVASVPSHCGAVLEDVVGVLPGSIYTIGATPSSPTMRHICRVSSDLTTWKPIRAVPYEGSFQRVVATVGGTVVALWGNVNAETPSVFAVVRGDAIQATCEVTPALGAFVTWSAPGSPNVHVFASPAASRTAPARHLVRRFDP